MRELSIATLNTYLCRFFGFDFCPELDRRAGIIRDGFFQVDADVVCLQEMWDPSLTAVVLSALSEYQVVRAHARCLLTPMDAGLVIASRLPVRQTIFQPICSTWRPKELLARRGLLTAIVEHDGAELAISSIHLGMGLAALRKRQHRAFLKTLWAVRQPHIVCGDFNVPAHDVEHRRFPVLTEMQQRGFRDAVAEFHGPAADRMVSIDPHNQLVKKNKWLRIDYIWIRSAAGMDWQVRDAKVVFNTPTDRLHPSDHYGVVARLLPTETAI